MERKNAQKGSHRVSLFLITFFLVYGSAHAYALLKARSALGFGWTAAAALSPVLLALVGAPLFVYLLGKHGMEGAARAASWIGYPWMGFLFFFVWMNLAVDVAVLAFRLAGAMAGTWSGPISPVAQKAGFFILVALSIVLSAYSFFEARDIGVEHVRIATDKLPASTRRLRIAQISDVHLGLLVRHEKAETIARLVRRADPDIVVSTGDLVDAQINELAGLAEIFAGIHPPLGKFAVTGNHEFYAGIEQALAFTRRAGFVVLRGQAVTAGGILRIAGVDDPAGAAFGELEGRPEDEILKEGPAGMFRLLLKHRPRASVRSRPLFDLQLSGHTHKGQIFPFRYVVARSYPYVNGLYSFGSSHLYTSPGTGTWGPPMRFVARPKVTLIDIEPTARPPGGAGP